MSDLSRIVAENQKKLRTERGLSLDALARESGVSRSRLAQIESGEANPSIATMWQIASALKVGFSELVTTSEDGSHVVGIRDAEPSTGDAGRYRVHLIFPFNPDLGFELYAGEVEPGGHISSNPHPTGTQEMVVVQTGQLRLEVAGQVHELAADDAIRFRADQAHDYRNPGDALTEFVMIVAYPRTS